MEAAGLISRTAEAEVRLGRTFTPNPAHYTHYQEMAARQKELYASLVAQEG